MRHTPIVKRRGGEAVAPNLVDYDRVRTAFSWAAARAELDGLPGGRGLNIAHEAVDRHAAGPRRDRVALRWLGKTGAVRDYTLRRPARAHQSLRQRARGRSASARASASTPSPVAFPSSTWPRSAR